MPKVTIIIPSYNHDAFLEQRLESIATQIFQDWEAIIIDDYSTDASVEIIEAFLKAHPDFKVKHFIKNKTNSGSGYSSWKKGIELAETAYIWIAETDDYSDPDFLKEGIDLLEKNKDAALFFCASNYVDEISIFLYNTDNRLKFLDVSESQWKKFGSEVFINNMPFNTLITNGSCVVFRRPDQKVPDFIFSHKQTSDIFLWTFLLQNKSFVYLDIKLNFFRRHKDSTSSKIQKFELKLIYFEIAKYLNYFNQTEKYNEFIEHYIKYYIWGTKKDFLSIYPIKEIKSEKKLVFIYFCKLFKTIFIKIFK